MPRPLEEAVVAITGASSGVGRATALRLARRGSSLALCARSPEPQEQVARECEVAGARVFRRPLDVADEAVWGRVSSSYVSPYNLSKHAVRVFSESLRGELAAAEDIHVTSIAPEAVDTPIFDRGANYSGHEIRPVLSPEQVAETIELCAESPRREVSYGRAESSPPSPGNVLAPIEPHAIEGGWRLHRRPTLRRAALAAALGALGGLVGGSAVPPRKRRR